MKYKRLVGKLVDLAVTKPELSYVVHTLAQFLQYPQQVHWLAALRVVHYLKKALGMGIMLSLKYDMDMSVYCDSNWEAYSLTRRSLTGYIVKIGDSLVFVENEKQAIVYCAMAHAFVEVKWVKEILHSLCVGKQMPIPMLCDNKVALHIAVNPVFHEQTNT